MEFLTFTVERAAQGFDKIEYLPTKGRDNMAPTLLDRGQLIVPTTAELGMMHLSTLCRIM
jgi:hypothetical protein